MKPLDDYLALQKQVHDYFGYVEDWRVLPVDDRREYYWRLNQMSDGGGNVEYGETIAALNNEEAANYYEDEIYTQRHLPKWVYRGAEFTMICVDTHTDGNQFLAIFNNAKEQK